MYRDTIAVNILQCDIFSLYIPVNSLRHNDARNEMVYDTNHNIIVVVADILAANKNQAISHQHDSDMIMLSQSAL